MKVALFVTCLGDHYFADAAADTVRLLRHLGCEVTFPEAQGCCGQPAYNAGLQREARRMADHTRRVLDDAEAVIVPSGSCAAMLKRVYPGLGGEGDGSTVSGRTLPDRTWELSEFLVHRLGVDRLGSGLSGRRVAVHQGCHALRELGLRAEPARLLSGAGARVVAWEAEEECCGFGGLFSVKMPAVSTAMADRKLDTLPAVDWVVSGDPGCLLHLQGRSRARGDGVGFRHLASVLWEGVGGPT